MILFDNDGAKALIKAIINITDEKECENFLEDLMTAKEILEISQRMEVAEMLKENMSYSVICEKTGASTATISRVNRCYIYGNGGYRNILEKMNKPDKKSGG
jgi:TrpR-related protein YerC/YecD